MLPFWLLGAAVVALDQWTKALVLARLPIHDVVPVIPDLLNLVHVRNPGAAFSLLSNAPAWIREPFFLVVTIGASIVIVLFALRAAAEEWALRLALGGILGGALGNFLDRLAYGEVIDFIDVYWNGWHWPAFNVADASISVSILAVLLQSFLRGDRPHSP